MRILLFFLFVSISLGALADINPFPIAVQNALNELDHSNLISKGAASKQEIRAQYTVQPIEADSNLSYEVLYWNTTSGASRLYHYDSEETKFVLRESSAQLPEDPLGFKPKGKVMAKYASVYASHERKAYYEVLFWDTKTGQSKLYYFNTKTRSFTPYNSSVQFPEMPLGEVKGEVMVDYTALYSDTAKQTYYEALFWDTKTGRSKLYYYDYPQKKFLMYPDNLQFPENPIGEEAKGEIMVDYTPTHISKKNKSYYEALFWDTETGHSKLYYYSYKQKTFKLYEDKVQFSKDPLGSEVEGSIMADYESFAPRSVEGSDYLAIFWDTKSGKSKLYQYDNESGTFIANKDNEQIIVPAIADNENEVFLSLQIEYLDCYGLIIYEVFFYNSKTGESRVFFYKPEAESFAIYKDSMTPVNPFGIQSK